MKSNITIWGFVLLFVVACGVLASMESTEYNRPRQNRPFSRLICTNTVVNVHFDSFLRCRFSDEDTFRYLHKHINVGDNVLFENAHILEIHPTFCTYNGVTNIFPEGVPLLVAA